MRIRGSGMPEESYWESLFDVPQIMAWLRPGRLHDVAELGCGYGTFTVPLARSIAGTVYSFDVDAAMLDRTRERSQGLPVVLEHRDVMADGFGVSVDAVLLFNILHCEEPVRLLQHSVAALKPDGEVYVIHWRHGETPRGPSLNIRPRPSQVIEWATEAGLTVEGDVVDLPPWHYGLRFRLNR